MACEGTCSKVERVSDIMFWRNGWQKFIFVEQRVAQHVPSSFHRALLGHFLQKGEVDLALNVLFEAPS